MSRTPQDSTRPFDSSVFEGPQFRKKREVPDGLWMRCDGCEKMLYRKVVSENMDVCPECGQHFRVNSAKRIEQLADQGSFEELFADVQVDDPLDFEWAGKRYDEYTRNYAARSGVDEAIRTGVAYIKGRRVALGVMDGSYIMGSLGSVVGERLTRLIEKAAEDRIPLIVVCTSGGARMHEGALSLMQMGKTSAALARLDEAGVLYVTVLAEPTFGGTTASFAMLGDLIIAEPGADVGFAGARVIANTIKADLPEGFQSAEFLQEHGFIDRVVDRPELRSELARIIDYCMP